MGRLIRDLSGQRFGRLVVIQRAPDRIWKSGKHEVAWYCNCDCGNTNIIVTSTGLKTGDTCSCGCYRTELRKQKHLDRRKLNRYDLSQEYGIGYDSNNKVFYFDLEDYEKIKNHTWLIDANGYVVSSTCKQHTMHRLIIQSDLSIDHINHQRHDNRKSNLREVTVSQNAMNSNRNNNSLNIKGVYWDQRNKKWCAKITKDGKTYSLGSYADVTQANQARLKAEDKLFGEYKYHA